MGRLAARAFRAPEAGAAERGDPAPRRNRLGAALTAATAREVPRWRPYLWHGVGLAFFVLVAWLAADYVKTIDWAGVRRSLSGYSAWTLGGAACLAALSHLTYAAYDLLGRAYAGHDLPARRVLGVAFVSYAFNLNLGSLVGGFGFRLRLYHRLGLRASQIGKVIALSLATNWSGWLLLAGAFFAAGRVPLPASFPVTALGLEALGFLMITATLLYIALCAGSRRRRWHWRAYAFRLPSGRLALAQVALASFNWLLIGTIVWLLMPRSLAYGSVVATQLTAAMLAVPTHVPGGLGVIETIFVAALGDGQVQSELIAALLAYRALYYLLPLAIAVVLYLAFEASVRAHRKRARSLV